MSPSYTECGRRYFPSLPTYTNSPKGSSLEKDFPARPHQGTLNVASPQNPKHRSLVQAEHSKSVDKQSTSFALRQLKCGTCKMLKLDLTTYPVVKRDTELPDITFL